MLSDAPSWDLHTHNPSFFVQPSDCSPVTDADRALIERVVGDPSLAVLPVRRQKCPTCEGQGRVTLDKASLKSTRCKRCNGGQQNDGCVESLSLDELTKKHVGNTFINFCYDPGGISSYRPSIYIDRNPEKKLLADAYDSVQAARGDKRRCYRG